MPVSAKRVVLEHDVTAITPDFFPLLEDPNPRRAARSIVLSPRLIYWIVNVAKRGDAVYVHEKHGFPGSGIFREASGKKVTQRLSH